MKAGYRAVIIIGIIIRLSVYAFFAIVLMGATRDEHLIRTELICKYHFKDAVVKLIDDTTVDSWNGEGHAVYKIYTKNSEYDEARKNLYQSGVLLELPMKKFHKWCIPKSANELIPHKGYYLVYNRGSYSRVGIRNDEEASLFMNDLTILLFDDEKKIIIYVDHDT